MEKIGRISSASVLKCTGKSWDQWLKILDKAGAVHWPHGEITALLKKKYRLSPWWQQGVAIGFETARGLRAEGRNLKGEYATVATRTIPLDVKKLWKFLGSPKGAAIWLKPLSPFQLKTGAQFESEWGAFGEVRTLKPARRARLSWQETEWPKPSILEIVMVPRPKGKAVLIFQHTGLRESRERLRLRTHWKTVLQELSATLSQP